MAQDDYAYFMGDDDVMDTVDYRAVFAEIKAIRDRMDDAYGEAVWL